MAAACCLPDLAGWNYGPDLQRGDRAPAGTDRLRACDGRLHVVASAITLSFHCAKYVASCATIEEKQSVFANLHLRSWIAGTGLGLFLFLFNGALARYLNLPESNPSSLLAILDSFQILWRATVERSSANPFTALQGPCDQLYALEGLVRLGGLTC